MGLKYNYIVTIFVNFFFSLACFNREKKNYDEKENDYETQWTLP